MRAPLAKQDSAETPDQPALVPHCTPNQVIPAWVVCMSWHADVESRVAHRPPWLCWRGRRRPARSFRRGAARRHAAGTRCAAATLELPIDRWTPPPLLPPPPLPLPPQGEGAQRRLSNCRSTDRLNTITSVVAAAASAVARRRCATSNLGLPIDR